MRLSSAATALGFLCAATASLHPRRSYETRDYFALHLDSATSPSDIAERLGARHEGQIGELDDHHTFSLPRENGDDLHAILDDLQAKRKLRRRGDAAGLLEKKDEGLVGILWSQKLAPKRRLQKRTPPSEEFTRASSETQENPEAVQARSELISTLGIADPIFDAQWHLFNTKEVGHDMNVSGVWLEGITGKGAISAVVDDGLDMYSNDLSPNYFPEGSYDFNDHTPEPRPRLRDDKHGTRCAGEIAAARNNVCGVGVAYDSKVSGVRILSGAIDDTDEASAINYAYQKNDIYSCSWGPPDDGATMEAPGILIKRAMVNGVQKGRDGKGSIFVFAAGNGAPSGDNCNFDGYTNSIYSITVGAIDREGKHASYSESCSAQLVVAYSSGSTDSIHTTDVGTDKCYSMHGGTSAAGPLVVGAMALVLSVRPELTWRDAQYLMIETAIPVHEDDGSWQMTKSGHKFSHDWGFGKVDIYSLVQKAKTWEMVKPQAWYHSPWLRVEHEVPQGDKGLAASWQVSEKMMKDANIARLEHVTVTMNVNHTRRGDLSVELRSPEGVASHLSTARRYDDAPSGYIDWTFMTVAHWGESGVGTWTVIVKDTEVNDNKGEFLDWRLNLWGEAADGSKQELHPLPDEHDDDHTIEDSVVVTTSVEPAPAPTEPADKPSHTVDRPVNTKPTPTDSEASESATPSPSPASDSFLPSFFPTFGASKHAQVWIYTAIGSIIIFCIGLGIYFQVQRRRRLRNDRDDYDFEMIEDEDETKAMNGSSTRRRGGELYNAFAGESEEEPLFSDEDDDDEPYRDQANPRRSGSADLDDTRRDRT
ncbi:peptidase S8/S53 domain-containing protein [Aspergillus pseudoustus]|uniref:Peptidase S8/S53 domain-containing protein n=1 Tax=Aspergillus pseudoustus TaxID=1810923 RepID=A0ABR4K8I3_9EURO